MKRRLEAVLRRYGQQVVWPETGREGLAFVQPVLVKRENPMSARTPLGEADRRRWLYIGSGEPPLAEGDRLRCQGMLFRVREAMPVCWEGQLLYWWAVLLPEKEAAE